MPFKQVEYNVGPSCGKLRVKSSKIAADAKLAHTETRGCKMLTNVLDRRSDPLFGVVFRMALGKDRPVKEHDNVHVDGLSQQQL
jgi:hypothetical protein